VNELNVKNFNLEKGTRNLILGNLMKASGESRCGVFKSSLELIFEFLFSLGNVSILVMFEDIFGNPNFGLFEDREKWTRTCSSKCIIHPR
jgi:hypothetical protein